MKLPKPPADQTKFFIGKYGPALTNLMTDKARAAGSELLRETEKIVLHGFPFFHSSEDQAKYNRFAEELIENGLGADLEIVLRAIMKDAEKQQYFELCANLRDVVKELDHFHELQRTEL